MKSAEGGPQAPVEFEIYRESLIEGRICDDYPFRSVSLDLLEFFEGSGRDLVNLALSLAGGEAPPTTLSVRATPTIETPLGPIRYPQPITIVSRTVGR